MCGRLPSIPVIQEHNHTGLQVLILRVNHCIAYTMQPNHFHGIVMGELAGDAELSSRTELSHYSAVLAYPLMKMLWLRIFLPLASPFRLK